MDCIEEGPGGEAPAKFVDRARKKQAVPRGNGIVIVAV